jgi:hypothetical protein
MLPACIAMLLNFVVLSAQNQPPLMRDFIGINVNAQLPCERMTKFRFTRNFHIWTDDQSNFNGNGTPSCPLPVPSNTPVPKIRWNPSYNTNRYIWYDDFYKKNARQNVAVLHGNAPVMYANSGEMFAKPICPGFNTSADIHADPNSWEAFTIRASLFAARYGMAPSGGFPAGFGPVAGQFLEHPDDTGLGQGSVGFIEVFNEPDASWHGGDNINQHLTGWSIGADPTQVTQYYFRPDQYAAMLSAVYDGNQNSSFYKITNASGTIGHWGIHNLSPDTKVVLAGTADLRYDYLYFMRKKWDELRGPGNYPFDIVNYHFYSTTSHPGIDQGNWNEFYRGRTFLGFGQGAFPESDNIRLRERIQKITGDRNNPDNPYYPGGGKLFPDKPTWITEFGYDTKGPTPISIESFCGYDAQTIHGQWITRYFLEASAAGGIDKVFMYQLNDDPALGNSLFGTSGLLKADGTPKKSWYHLQTLKSVLDATRFSSTNSNLDVAFLRNGQIMPADDPRIYTYVFENGNLQTPTIVAWVPRGKSADCDAIRYKGALLIEKAYPSEPKPVIQAIETGDFDEDGQRTKIELGLIDVYTAPSGKKYWRINGIHHGDTQATLTETPVYFRVNQSLNESDPVPPPVDHLTGNCLGCNAVRIKWTIPQGVHYAWYALYYQEIECSTTNPVFDPQKATMFADHLPGNCTEAVIPGLKQDGTICYLIWVVPFVSAQNGGPSGVYTYSPVGMSQPIATHHYFILAAGSCRPCDISFQASQVTITQDPWGGSSYLRDQFFESILPANQTVECDELASDTPPSNFGILVSNNNTLQFVLDFGQPKMIDALYLYYKSGAGRISIEYMRDCCPQFIQIPPIDIKDATQGVNQFWYRMVNSILNQQRVEKLRITITGLQETGIVLNRIYFCTHPASDLCPGNNTASQEQVLPASNVILKHLDAYSALITWNTAYQLINNTEHVPITAYTIRYSISIDAAGQLVLPQSFQYSGPDWGGDNEFALSPLVPNTTYYVDIVPDAAAYPCLKSLPAGRIAFTTPAIHNERGNTSTYIAPPEVTVFPNPAQGTLNIQLPTDTYTDYRINRVNGVQVLAGLLNEQENQQRISLKDLQEGIYVLVLTGTNVARYTKAFIVMRL